MMKKDSVGVSVRRKFAGAQPVLIEPCHSERVRLLTATVLIKEYMIY